MADCDICHQPIEPGQPRYGAPGTGGKDGPKLGSSRHYGCHTTTYGQPDRRSSAELFDELREAFYGQPAEPKFQPCPVLDPKVKAGPYNRSDNAARGWKRIGEPVSEMGRRRFRIECPFCFHRFWAFAWSLAGGGKKCPNCGAMHGSTGQAWPIAGNEDLETEEAKS